MKKKKKGKKSIPKITFTFGEEVVLPRGAVRHLEAVRRDEERLLSKKGLL